MAQAQLTATSPLLAVIGKGEMDKKSKSLVGAEPRMQKFGITVPPIISLTSEFPSRVRELCRAKAVGEKVDAAALAPTHEEIGALEHAVELIFNLKGPRPIFVRSGESAEGTGALSSHLASPNLLENGKFSDNVKEMALQIWVGVQKVVASAFEGDAPIFLKKKGMSDEFGLMLMPAVGSCGKDDEKNLFAPAFSITYIGKVNGRQRADFFRGFVGDGAPEFELGSDDVLSIPNTKIGNFVLMVGPASVFSLADKTMRTDIWCHELEWTKKLLEKPQSARLYQISKFAASEQHYGEYIVGFDFPAKIYAVQYAPFTTEKVEFPPGAWNEALISDKVVGTKKVCTTRIKFAGPLPTEEDAIFNYHNENYALVIPKTGARGAGFQQWKMKHLSNASALYLIGTPGFGSHLWGLFRSLGIPILWLKYDLYDALGVPSHEKGDQDVHFTGVRDIPLTTYCDEFNKNGPIGVVVKE